MATDIILAERMPASQPAAAKRGTGATFSHSHSDQAIQPYLCDTTGLEASTRRAGASNDTTFPSGTKVKNDSLGSAAVYRHRQMESSDNRKIAIVPIKVDTPGAARRDETAFSVPNATQPTLPSPLAGRRKFVVGAQLAEAGSALVPPPDTTLHDVPSSLTPSSPSSSASLSPTTPKSPHSPSSARQEKPRTARSLAHSRTPSRDVGIVGTLTRRELTQDLATIQDTRSDYQPPIFQTPSSRSSSLDIPTLVNSISREPNPSVHPAISGEAHVRPTAMSASVEPIPSAPHVINGHGTHTQSLSTHSLDISIPRSQLIDTPEQGQASPDASSSVSAAPSSYLHYQPGVHSRAGPLPPPPRAMFDIDFNAPPPPRPPRLRSPSPLTSQKAPGGAAPTSVTVRLASKPSTVSIHQIQISATPALSTQSSSEESDYSLELETVPTNPVHHAREGAFPPSTILATPAKRLHSLPEKSIRLVPEVPSKDQLPDPPTDVLDPAPAITVQPTHDGPSPSTSFSPELRRESSWISNSNDSSHISSESSRHAFDDARYKGLNDSYSSMREFAAEESPSEPKRKGGILTNLKRYSSLPRPPSMVSQRMSVFTRTPPPSPPKPRIRARSPDAMRCKEILKKKSSSERAAAYANKINELSKYDCGLGDWVTSMKEKGSSKTRLVPVPPSQNPDCDLNPRPRHSRASISSECTFPLRADAYIATDLSQRDSDTVPSPNVPPPALPYPALAGVSTANSRQSTTTTGAQLSHATSLSMGSKVAGTLFSSLGRNVSTRNVVSKPALPARTTKLSLTAPNPRPVQIVNAPSVPGGPRALPGRVQRSHTLMLSSPPTSGNASTSLPMCRRSNTLKRPSFFGRSPGSSPESDVSTNTEFTRQVERLADLLPHADKDVLAGYLSRAGQDILAIGQYLEDEKNGNVRRH